MTDRFRNTSEVKTFTKRQNREGALARWDGRQAFIEGRPFESNPHTGWVDIHSHKCFLWCRFGLGWLVEFERARNNLWTK